MDDKNGCGRTERGTDVIISNVAKAPVEKQDGKQ